jgi:Nif-specific regulatory protein
MENCMERAVLSAKEDVITGSDLPPSLQTAEENMAGRPHHHKTTTHADFETLVNTYERELIVEALKANRGNVSAAARALNLSNRIIHYKIRKLHITPEWYRIRS